MKRVKELLASAAVLAVCSAPALAGFTVPAGTGTGGEPDAFAAVLNNAAVTYRGFSDWAPAGVNLTGGAGLFTLTRVDDFGVGSPLHLVTGAPGLAEDDVWVDGTARFVAEAKFAGNDHEFGWNVGAVNNPLIASTGAAFTSGTPSASTLIGPGAFSWYLKNNAGSQEAGVRYTSDPTLNADGADHMVTYRLTGPGIIHNVWLLWFEDLSLPNVSNPDNEDYQDAVIEVRVVPVPMAAVAGVPLLGLACGWGWKRRRAELV